MTSGNEQRRKRRNDSFRRDEADEADNWLAGLRGSGPDPFSAPPPPFDEPPAFDEPPRGGRPGRSRPDDSPSGVFRDPHSPSGSFRAPRDDSPSGSFRAAGPPPVDPRAPEGPANGGRRRARGDDSPSGVFRGPRDEPPSGSFRVPPAPRDAVRDARDAPRGDSPSGTFRAPRDESPSGSFRAPRDDSPSGSFRAPRDDSPSGSFRGPRDDSPSGVFRGGRGDSPSGTFRPLRDDAAGGAFRPVRDEPAIPRAGRGDSPSGVFTRPATPPPARAAIEPPPTAETPETRGGRRRARADEPSGVGRRALEGRPSESYEHGPALEPIIKPLADYTPPRAATEPPPLVPIFPTMRPESSPTSGAATGRRARREAEDADVTSTGARRRFDEQPGQRTGDTGRRGRPDFTESPEPGRRGRDAGPATGSGFGPATGTGFDSGFDSGFEPLPRTGDTGPRTGDIGIRGGDTGIRGGGDMGRRGAADTGRRGGFYTGAPDETTGLRRDDIAAFRRDETTGLRRDDTAGLRRDDATGLRRDEIAGPRRDDATGLRRDEIVGPRRDDGGGFRRDDTGTGRRGRFDDAPGRRDDTGTARRRGAGPGAFDSASFEGVGFDRTGGFEPASAAFESSGTATRRRPAADEAPHQRRPLDDGPAFDEPSSAGRRGRGRGTGEYTSGGTQRALREAPGNRPAGRPDSRRPDQIRPAAAPARVEHRPHRWIAALSVIGVIVLLAACGLGSWFIFKDEKNGPDSARATAPAGPKKRDISSRQVDPNPLSEAEVFPQNNIIAAPDEQPYLILKTQASPDCKSAATDSLATLLAGAGCSEVVRATMKSPNEEYLITAGIFNLDTEKSAATAFEGVKPIVDGQKGRFAGMSVGAGTGTDAIVRAPTQLGWNYRGHFIAFVVIARVDGKDFAPDDPYPNQITFDIVETYLENGIIGNRAIVQPEATPAASLPPAPPS